MEIQKTKFIIWKSGLINDKTAGRIYWKQQIAIPENNTLNQQTIDEKYHYKRLKQKLGI